MAEVGTRERRGTRRAGRAVTVAGLALVASSIGAPATQAAAELGFGQAQAVLVMIDPRSAELSFGVRFGPTVADHRNEVARAVAQSTDYGLIGSALTGVGCTGSAPSLRAEDLPQPIRADSRNPGDGVEHAVQEGPIRQSVLALPQPFSQATSRLGELEIPGVLRIAGASNRTTSGADEDGLPTATGTVDIAEVALAGGLVELRGLHWEAVVGHGEEPHGAFTIGGASISGIPIPTQDASAVVSSINGVLSQLGLVLTPPRSHVEEGTLFVDPIRFGIAPNPARDQIAGTLLAAIQPIREQLFGLLLEASCDSAAAITVVDILLGSFTGGGSLTVNVGGAQAQLTDAASFQGLGLGAPAPAPPTGSQGSGASVTRRPTKPTGATTPGSIGSDGAITPAPVAATETGTKSDGAIAVGILAVLLGAALLEADRRKMIQAGVALAPPNPALPEATPG